MTSYLSNRVLKINVGFLLNEGPAHSHDSELDFPAVRIAEDLTLGYVRGRLRLSRTKEGILVQAHLHIGMQDECFRCLDPVARDIEVDLEELYTFHSMAESEFSIDEDAVLDLNPLLRAEVLIKTDQRAICRPDCKGICPDCGANLNHESCECQQDTIDPRFAALRQLLDDKR